MDGSSVVKRFMSSIAGLSSRHRVGASGSFFLMVLHLYHRNLLSCRTNLVSVSQGVNLQVLRRCGQKLQQRPYRWMALERRAFMKTIIKLTSHFSIGNSLVLLGHKPCRLVNLLLMSQPVRESYWLNHRHRPQGLVVESEDKSVLKSTSSSCGSKKPKR